MVGKVEKMIRITRHYFLMKTFINMFVTDDFHLFGALISLPKDIDKGPETKPHKLSG